MDIQTASYYELIDWLERVGLSTEGDKRTLQSRLQSYYRSVFPKLKIAPEEKTADPESDDKGKERLHIERAGRLEFSPEGEEGKAETRITGGVLIYMTDEESESTHRVEAHSLVFNRSESLLSAEGDVVYEMEKGEKTEKFTGEKISFNVENYRGVFIGGMSERGKTVEEEEISFYFRGAVIYRRKEDSVFLERGVLTSSTIEDPYYHIAADRFWILGPDEWAFNDALLYMGRVPIFYFPFFFHPGDDLVFHPSFGYRNVEGYYFQTTTYLLGRKKEMGRNENSLSFLQLIEEDSSTYAAERKGLFLRQTEEPAQKTWVEESDSHIKLYFDYYSHLGLFTGIDFDINKLGFVNSFDASAGAGLTDYIFSREGYEAYTSPYREETAKEYNRYSQKQWFLGSQLPLRFGLALHSDINWNNLKWKFDFPLYSDPYFHNLFKERDEEILWGSLLQGEELGERSNEPLADPVFASRLSYRAPVPSQWSLLSSFSVNRFNTSLALKSVELPPDFTEIESTPKNPLGFYYPQQFTPLDASLTIRGKLFESSSQTEKESRETEDRDVEKFRPPWEAKENEEEDADTYAKEETESPRLPEKIDDSNIYRRKSKEVFTHSLSYTFTPDVSFHSRYDDEQRKDPSSVAFDDPQFSYVDSSLYGLFSYNSSIFDSAVKMDNSITFRGKYRDHKEESEDVDISDYHTLNQRLNRLSIDNKTTVTGSLLKEYRELDSSKITYTLDSRYFTYRYDDDEDISSYVPEYISWDTDSVRSHKMRIDLIRETDKNSQSLFYEGTLPPEDPDTVTGIKAETGPFEGELRFRSRKEPPEDKTIYGPLDATAKLNLWEKSYVRQGAHLFIPEEDDYSESLLALEFFDGNLGGSQSFNWNIAENRAERAKSSFNFHFFSTELEYRYVPDYTFDPEDAIWEKEEEKSFQAYRSSARIDGKYAPDPMWKDRIRLDTALSASYYMDMQRFTDNILGIELNIDASIAEFFEFNLSLRSENNSLYQYVPAYAESLEEVEYKNVFVDFLRSLNIFNRDDLLDTDFNLQSLSLSAVHHMNDWDLSLIYSGEPGLNEEEKKYNWESEFSIVVQWKPIPEIRKEAEYSGEELLF
ncbi:MAG: hypothetical protein ACOC2B_00360 [Sediminispirochaetaceae bacterium]